MTSKRNPKKRKLDELKDIDDEEDEELRYTNSGWQRYIIRKSTNDVKKVFDEVDVNQMQIQSGVSYRRCRAKIEVAKDKYEASVQEAKDNYDAETEEALECERQQEEEHLARFILKDIIQDLIIDNETRDYLINEHLSSSTAKGNSNNRKN